MRPEELRGAVHELWKRHGRVGGVAVVGRSMAPLLADGDAVAVRFGTPEKLRVGEIVLFERRGTSVVHRVLATRGRGGSRRVLERGDAGPAGTWIARESILGVVVGRGVPPEITPLESRLASRWRALRSVLVHLAVHALGPERLRGWRSATHSASAAIPDAALDWLVRGALDLEGGRVPELAAAQWQATLRLAERHRVAPLLWRALAGDPTGVPDEVAGRLRSLYYATAARSARLLDELERIGRRLDDAGIPWLALKGVRLALRLWGNVALRPTDDLDLLVRAADVEGAAAALRPLGFALRDPRATAIRRAWHYQAILDRGGASPLCLELHWALDDRFSLTLPDEEGIWRRAREHRIDPLDEALYLALHLDKHGVLNRYVAPGDDALWVRRFVLDVRSENRLLWLADLRRALVRPDREFTVNELVERARAWHATEALGRSLLLLDRLGDGELPAELRALLPQRARRRRRLACRIVFRSPPAPGAERVKPWLLARGGRSGFRPLRLLDLLRYLAPPRTYLERRHRQAAGRPLRARWLHLSGLFDELRQLAEAFLPWI
jgi:hypothetical protein